MLKQCIKFSIVVIIQWVPLAILASVLSSLFINNPGTFIKARHFFTQFKWVFLLGHLLFYTVLFLLWPRVVLFFTERQKDITALQIKKAIHMRVYLLGLLLILEGLTLVR